MRILIWRSFRNSKVPGTKSTTPYYFRDWGLQNAYLCKLSKMSASEFVYSRWNLCCGEFSLRKKRIVRKLKANNLHAKYAGITKNLFFEWFDSQKAYIKQLPDIYSLFFVFIFLMKVQLLLLSKLIWEGKLSANVTKISLQEETTMIFYILIMS